MSVVIYEQPLRGEMEEWEEESRLKQNRGSGGQESVRVVVSGEWHVNQPRPININNKLSKVLFFFFLVFFLQHSLEGCQSRHVSLAKHIIVFL